LDTVIYSWDIDQNRGGKVLNKGGAAQAKQVYNFRNNQIPYYRVLEILESSDSLVLLPKEGELTRIQRFPATGNSITYTFDATNKLIKVEAPASKQKLVFSDYVLENGFSNSATVTLFVNDALATEEKIKNWKYNFTPEQNQFNLPQGYTLTARGTPSVSEIAKDIYLIDHIGGDRNVLFVNMDEYIVVIEAPLSSETSKDIISRINETIPGKPVKYVFATHYHNDHTGGLRQYAFEDATLLMAEHTTEYVNDLLSAKQPDDFGSSNKKANIQTFKNKLELKDKNHHIIFYEVPNTHADGMALAYFPKEKIIYQGDLLSVPLDGSLPYSIPAIEEMQDFIQKNKITYNRMIGHHGLNNITPEMVKQILNYKKK
jgi:glyoxylase-like metal-dependent hydrolase (beta-lactamase superfamily II)